jgi:hypothetical protein
VHLENTENPYLGNIRNAYLGNTERAEARRPRTCLPEKNKKRLIGNRGKATVSWQQQKAYLSKPEKARRKQRVTCGTLIFEKHANYTEIRTKPGKTARTQAWSPATKCTFIPTSEAAVLEV